jgi:hypothetical protein
MTQDVSGFGLALNIVASSTYPNGIPVTQFAGDVDPLDIPEVKIADFEMGLNGDLVSWSRAMPIVIKIAVINGSDDDQNLAVLFEANRVGQGKTSAYDLINFTGVYPQGNTVSLSNGKITDGMPGSSVASNGRQKTKTYSFVFQNITVTQPTLPVV